jgi:hypothetical protein
MDPCDRRWSWQSIVTSAVRAPHNRASHALRTTRCAHPPDACPQEPDTPVAQSFLSALRGRGGGGRRIPIAVARVRRRGFFPRRLAGRGGGGRIGLRRGRCRPPGRGTALANPPLLEGRCSSGGFGCLRLLLSHCKSAAGQQRGADHNEVPHGRFLRLHRIGDENVLQRQHRSCCLGSPADAPDSGHRGRTSFAAACAFFDVRAWPVSVG